MTRIAILTVLALATSAAAQLESYQKTGNLDGLRLGTYYWGQQITKADLEGKVILVQQAGL